MNLDPRDVLFLRELAAAQRQVRLNQEAKREIRIAIDGDGFLYIRLPNDGIEIYKVNHHGK